MVFDDSMQEKRERGGLDTNNQPLVSIHIITYNQIDFIHETLTSALEQDYENLEVVVGDVVKMGCFLMGFVLFAKGLATVFIVTEITISVLFVLLTYIFVDSYGLIGVTYAYVTVYGINFFWLMVVMRNYFSGLHEKDKVTSR